MNFKLLLHVARSRCSFQFQFLWNDGADVVRFNSNDTSVPLATGERFHFNQNETNGRALFGLFVFNPIVGLKWTGEYLNSIVGQFLSIQLLDWNELARSFQSIYWIEMTRPFVSIQFLDWPFLVSIEMKRTGGGADVSSFQFDWKEQRPPIRFISFTAISGNS